MQALRDRAVTRQRAPKPAHQPFAQRPSTGLGALARGFRWSMVHLPLLVQPRQG
jgi:hypothetical protein